MSKPDLVRRSDAHRTLILTEVLSNGPFRFEGDYELLREAISTGDCSGRTIADVSVPISDHEAARLLIAQGSDPQFLIGTQAEEAAAATCCAEDASAPDYTDEAVIQVANGCQVRVLAHPAECSYVRVISAQGLEVGYWNQDEWQQAPAEVMGAIFGATLSPVSAVSGVPSRHAR